MKIFFTLTLLLSNVSFAAQKISKCTYNDFDANVEFKFDVEMNQDSSDYKSIDSFNYYVSVTPGDEEYILIAVIPLDKNLITDKSKNSVGMGYNFVTNEGFIDERDQQRLECVKY